MQANRRPVRPSPATHSLHPADAAAEPPAAPEMDAGIEPLLARVRAARAERQRLHDETLSRLEGARKRMAILESRRREFDLFFATIARHRKLGSRQHRNNPVRFTPPLPRS